MQVAARATGVGRATFDDALSYAHDRQSFGKPIWEHQAVGNLFADMGTKLAAARETSSAVAEVAICYTGNLSVPTEKLYTLHYYLQLAEQIVAAAAHTPFEQKDGAWRRCVRHPLGPE